MANPCEVEALEYLRRYNFSVIPVGQDKKPIPGFSWKAFQERRANEVEIKGFWTLYPQAQVAIVTGAISNLSVIDVDSEEGMENLAPFLPNPFTPPMVFTPRGGYHFYCRHDPRVSSKVGVIPGTDLRAEGGYVVAPPSLGVNGSKYSWDQDSNLESISIPPLPSAYIEKVAGSAYIQPLAKATGDFMTVGRRNNDLFHSLYSMTKLVDATELRSIALQLGRTAKPPMDEREIEIVLKSVLERASKKDVSLAQDVSDYVSVQDGFFSVNEIIREFDATGPFGKEDRRNIHTIVHRLVEKGTIERYGEKSGVYRRIEKEKTLIDWENAQAKALDLALPLGLNDYVYTLPKAIIGVAGFPSAGKTAFCLETIKKNMYNWNTLYLCSDLGPEEIKSRLEKHEDVPGDGWNFEAIERTGNFADAIDPNGLNIVDYVRLDEVWRVAAVMESIWNKLQNGVAIVCIQKSWGRVLGRGKEWSLEKARLYLSMDPGKVRVIKCKNFHHGIDPVGYARYFDLLDGWKFELLGPWKYEPLSDKDFATPVWEKSRKLF